MAADAQQVVLFGSPVGSDPSVVRNKEKDYGVGLTGDAPCGMSDEHFLKKSATTAFNIKKNELITTLGSDPTPHLRRYGVL